MAPGALCSGQFSTVLTTLARAGSASLQADQLQQAIKANRILSQVNICGYTGKLLESAVLFGLGSHQRTKGIQRVGSAKKDWP